MRLWCAARRLTPALLFPFRGQVTTRLHTRGFSKASKEIQFSLRTRILVTAGIGSAFFGWWVYLRYEKQGLNDHIVGLGGVKFELTDQSGRKVKGHDLLVGQWSLLYFGFTHCPDVCPEEMEKVSGVVHTLDKDTNLPRVQPVFVTIDPQRDDVAAVAQYIKDFHPRLVGLTGSPEQISAISKAYRVYAQPGPRDPTDQEYVVDHSIITYLICPHGAVLEFYNRSVEEADMAEKVRQRLRAHRL
uniref:Protein SCO2 homolog, mitochondrial-like n=1 Tax=Petromyzon marinus TaxID=7757 RepID=A0AAJ7TUB2_PETMA|nr:protein SCO2 homolog, mitochondrial-like [Petromyzon marinus]XP_032824245.1 protein SCO2 homolog, mitochondrial-like [Petromyzon marinus]XP_032824246.1 protein SCO2 homolog, mitochondrial-like [Petromyzon marinus]XP_032824247.1 protein SCO2 homolog, mitochondrial-like [Petromyzon marinus]XP_032824248.1 protein SCO2 homolog, mitochondrial-like [Petromyzon marinus]XP_032824249.1 protein SCO2 homolog, mitochondrial-like [Petromyzon marinus]XP_032824250.1 protein SCO2 homolog, mitochondrial-li